MFSFFPKPQANPRLLKSTFCLCRWIDGIYSPSYKAPPGFIFGRDFKILRRGLKFGCGMKFFSVANITFGGLQLMSNTNSLPVYFVYHLVSPKMHSFCPKWRLSVVCYIYRDFFCCFLNVNGIMVGLHIKVGGGFEFGRQSQTPCGVALYLGEFAFLAPTTPFFHPTPQDIKRHPWYTDRCRALNLDPHGLHTHQSSGVARDGVVMPLASGILLIGTGFSGFLQLPIPAVWIDSLSVQGPGT